MSAVKGGGTGLVLIGVASVAYGLYVGFTRRSYWISTYTYLIPVLLVAFAFAAA